MSGRQKTYGFGVNPADSQNHFFVVIPPKNPNSHAPREIEIYERFQWTPPGLTREEEMAKAGVSSAEELKLYSDEQILQKSDILRLRVSWHKWSLLVKDITAEFNTRLGEKKLTKGRFSIGGTPVERLFGKEMMVLLWGVEDCDPSNVPTAIRNWKGLMPEERWWLYTMTNASTGGIKDTKGWRTALRYALCENPIQENPQISLTDYWGEEE